MQKNLTVNLRAIAWLFFFFISAHTLIAQPFRYTRTIKWDNDKLFQNASASPEKYGELPVYTESFPLFTMNDSILQVKLENVVFDTINPVITKDSLVITGTITPEYSRTIFRKKPFLNISVLPYARDDKGKIQKVLSFSLSYEVLPGASGLSLKSTHTYADNSVLANGRWYKLFLDKTGIYKLSREDLIAIDPAFESADPRSIRIYGNGGGMLPEPVSASRIDDLAEVPVSFIGEEDGKLDGGDYLLFYAEGPDIWKYNATGETYRHLKNLYTDQACYFITYGQGNGKRVQPLPSASQDATNFISRFDDFLFYDKDNKSLIKSGKNWYDKETFEFTTSRNYRFSFPGVDVDEPVVLTAYVAARSTTGSTYFTTTANGAQVMNINLNPVSNSDFADYAIKAVKSASFDVTQDDIDLKLTYNKAGNEATGYLNYLELNAIRHLNFTGGQLSFRSKWGYGPGKVAEYTLTSGGQQLTIWDVTGKNNVRAVQATRNGNNYIFRLTSDTLREFVAFDGSYYNSILSHAVVENQNLHGAGNFDLLIVTHPDFINEANELADFHRTRDNLTVLVTIPEKIYNEFSSGVQDITAIRDFVSMLYNRAPAGKELRYLLLFGDASYDYKDRVYNNTNFVPAYQSEESLAPIYSYVTDDFYGMLESNDSLQIGIGRIPVTTAEQARGAIEKIRHYSSNEDVVKNDWRNLICFVSDDEDINTYMDDADKLTNQIYLKDPTYNVDKIFVDAYQQLSTPGGARSPEVNAAINLRMGRGALIMNYIGHGGETGWAHERILEIPDIKAWTNFSQMPVFLTATCEFTRYDDPELISAGEWVFLNPGGGGIALFTTTRPTYADQNYLLSSSFYSYAFNKTNGVYPRMGDIIVSAKNKYNAGSSNRRFVLIGDPALRMAYPDLNVFTTSVNGVTDPAQQDTIKALSTITVTGEIRDDSGNPVTSFNGTVFPTIYDKMAQITTLANDGGNPYTFSLRKNIIYKGQADVVNGTFSFSFIVPKDIAYQYGTGRVSYYARSNETDASGFDSDIVVGGYDNDASVDVTGPVIRLFMNDTTFIYGGLTDQNPKMLALVTDESGINTVGNGIGHDITVTLDDDSKEQKIANDYYSSDKNTYKSGSILYPFFNLSDGRHSLKLKIWDIYNNSTDAKIEFVVASSAELALQHIFNYPNPFRDQTTFSFEYNRPDTELDVAISIYDFTGHLVTTIKDKLYTSGYRANTIRWDGTTEGGWKISSGNYVYNIVVTAPDGETIQKASKLVVIR